MKLVPSSALASSHLRDVISGDDREKLLLKSVLERLGYREFSVAKQQPPKPDCCVSFGHDNATPALECELVRYHADAQTEGGSKTKAAIEIWRKTAHEPRKQLHQAGFSNVYGALSFLPSEYEQLIGCSQKQLIGEIVEICRQVQGQPGDISFPREGSPLLSKVLQSLTIFDFDVSDGEALWWCKHLQSGQVPNPVPSLIEIVKSKADKSYKWTQTNERWLLIVVEAQGLTDIACQISDPLLEKLVFNVPFSKILLWDRFFEEVTELFPKFQKICDSAAKTRHFDMLPKSLSQYNAKDRIYPVHKKQC